LCCLTAAFAAGKEDDRSPAAKASPGKQSIAHPEGVAAYCFDGDTLKLTDRRIVRIACIDAPEMAHGAARTQYYAREARQELIRLTERHKVRLVTVENAPKDRHGRIEADVQREDGQSLSALMISRGAAYFYPHKNQNAAFQKKLLSLQQHAIAQRRGFWAHLLSLPLARGNYTGNRDSLRFFPADCPEVQHIKPRNKVYFGTLMDAFLAGYAPARICLFWPTVP
jgi:endonuclease YncB( thermonuclease family)